MSSSLMNASELSAFNIAAYMRVTSLAVAAYDYLGTLPTGWRLYKEHWQSQRLTISIVLFSLLRCVSVATLTISNVGFFYSRFTQTSCGHYYLVPPAFKVAQAMVTQAILGIRAFNLSRRSKAIGWFLLSAYCAACALQWVASLYHRTPVVGPVYYANCRAKTQVKKLSAFVFYAIAMTYDILTTTVSVWYLLKYQLATTNSVVTKVTRMMLYDGLGYLFVLTGINIFNLILFKTSQDIQTAASSLAYTVSWIMSQRLLIHLYDASREHRDESLEGAEITITKNIGTARDISRVVRTQFDKSNAPFDLARRTTTHFESGTDEGDSLDEVAVQVRIEKTVKLNHYAKTYELEDYSRRSHRMS